MNILVSACLLGVACRYDGKSKPYTPVIELMGKYNLIPFCPEITGGLTTPRPPSEIVGDKVLNNLNQDVTPQYTKGAQEALRVAKLYNCKYAILKEKSPSCGSGLIHNGKFDGGLTKGDGITAKLLKENGITVFGESEIQNIR
ncbi:MAG: DUF523 domain-containing protein [Clostridia bacterium]|nr:DUF523 domain-containing protein [Clostridia bacterium]